MRLLFVCFCLPFLLSCNGFRQATALKDTMQQVKIIAHRGAWKKNNLPENSIAALQQAIQSGYYGSEFDVRMTIDDSLVINHDPEFHHISIEKNTYAALMQYTLSNGEKLPTLREYILAGLKNNTTTKFICEIKPSGISKERASFIAKKVLEHFDTYQAGKKVVYISFDYNILQTILSIQPDAITQYLEGNKSPAQLKADGIMGADYHLTSWQNNPGWITEAKKNKIALNVWTVNTTADMDWVINHQIDYITTNEPELFTERTSTTPVNNGWQLTWSDEFSYTGLPDSNKWVYETGGHGWGNNEQQFYVAKSLENTYVKNGILHIVAQKKKMENSAYTSAKITTYKKVNIQYGKIEVMAKLPRGKGTWPAIWMLAETLLTKKEEWPLCGEIDIMEHVGKDSNVVHTSLHSYLYNHIKQTQITYFDTLQNVFDQFHKYGIEWTGESIKFIIDDRLYFESKKGQDNRISTNEGWPFDKPFYLILNLAIGGNWGGEIDQTIFPSDFQIDFVRIYSKKRP